MKRSTGLGVPAWMLLLALVIAASIGGSALAENQSPDQMIRDASSGVRSAERAMHNGQREDAAKGVQAAAEILYRVRQLDPNHSKLTTTIWKAEGIRDTLQKRMGKTIPLATDPDAEPPAASQALPDDPEKLAQVAADLLRKAESEMHNGRNKESKVLLEKAAPAVSKLRNVDPGHRRLMALETALANQTNTVEKRLAPPSAPAAALAPVPAASAVPSRAAASVPATAAATAPAQAPPGKLPYHTRNVVNDIGQHLGGASGYIEDLKSGQGRLDDSILLNRAATRLEAAEKLLPTLRDQAATDGVSGDPRVASIEPEIAQMKAQLAELRSATEKRQAAAEQLQVDADADVAALRNTYDRLNTEYFTKATGSAIYYNDLEAPRETLALIERFETQELPAARAQWDAFAKKYGSTGQEVNQATGNQQAQYPFEGIRDGIANVAKTRVAMAEDLVKRSKDRIESLPMVHDIYRVKGHDDARNFLKLAQAFSPDHPAVKQLNATIEAQLQSDLANYAKKIESKEWPGNSKGKEARAAMAFFQNDPGWGKRDKNPRAEDKEPRKPLGVAITGNWSVQKKDLLGQPTMYGLPALVAVQLDREKPMALARVYSVTLRTNESAKPEMEPPFASITVGDSYYVKAEKVK